MLKQFPDKCTMIPVSFRFGGCVDGVVDSQADYQGYCYDFYFLRWNTFAVMHFGNGEGVCYIIIRTIFDVYSL